MACFNLKSVLPNIFTDFALSSSIYVTFTIKNSRI